MPLTTTEQDRLTKLRAKYPEQEPFEPEQPKLPSPLLRDPAGKRALAADISPTDVEAGVVEGGGIRSVPVPEDDVFERSPNLNEAENNRLEILQRKYRQQELPTIPPRAFKNTADEFVRAVARGTLNVGSGLLAEFADVGQASIFDVDKINEWAEKAREISRKPKFQPGTDGGVRGFVANAVGDALPFMAGTIAATLVAGPVAGFSVAYAVEGRNAYFDALDAGASEEDAELEGFVVGSINAALELLQIKRVIKFAKSGKGTIGNIVQLAKAKSFANLKRAGKALGKEALNLAITEGVQEALQETVSTLAPALTGRDLPEFNDAIKRIGMAFVGGAVAGPILGGAGAVVQSMVASKDFEKKTTFSRKDVKEIFGIDRSTAEERQKLFNQVKAEVEAAETPETVPEAEPTAVAEQVPEKAEAIQPAEREESVVPQEEVAQPPKKKKGKKIVSEAEFKKLQAEEAEAQKVAKKPKKKGKKVKPTTTERMNSLRDQFSEDAVTTATEFLSDENETFQEIEDKFIALDSEGKGETAAAKKFEHQFIDILERHLAEKAKPVTKPKKVAKKPVKKAEIAEPEPTTAKVTPPEEIIIKSPLTPKGDFRKNVEDIHQKRNVLLPKKDQAAAKLKKFVSTVPEFAEKAEFTVQNDMLIFQDGGRFRFEPGTLGLKADQLKEGQVVKFDLESYGIKPPSAKKIEKAKALGLKAPAKAFGAKNKIVDKAEFEKLKADEAKAKPARGKRAKGMRKGSARIFTAKDVARAGKFGIYYFEGGLRKFADWSAQMVKTMGEAVKPHLEKVWAESKREVEAFEVEPAKQPIPEKVKTQSVIAKQMAQVLKEQGRDLGLEYDPIVIDEQVEKAQNLVQTKPEEAKRIAFGKQDSTDILNNAVRLAYFAQQEQESNWDEAARIANWIRAENTRLGQEIVVNKGFVTENSPIKYVKQVQAARAEAVGKRFGRGKKGTGAKKAADRVNQEVAKAKEKTKAARMNIQNAQDFIESLKC